MSENIFKSMILFIVIFTGTGCNQWKHKDREKLFNDIEAFRKLSDKIEYEIDDLFEDIEDDPENDLVNILQNESNAYSIDESIVAKQNFTNSHLSSMADTKERESQIKQHHGKSNKEIKENNGWPKFEDLLLQIGVTYDWKNDRWLKVKKKFYLEKYEHLDNSNRVLKISNVSHKHHFVYRTVRKSIKSKSKRNIVIAVKAVR